MGGPGPRPRERAPVRIELRDTTEQDAPSFVLGSADSRVRAADALDDRSALTTATLDVPEAFDLERRDLTLWARVAVSDTPRPSNGDWVTTQAIPVRLSEEEGWLVDVEVRLIGGPT